MEFRETEFYKKLDAFTATGIAEGFVEEKSAQKILTAWQWLHDTRLAYQLQGWFGRMAQDLIVQGLIEA
jgi:hypothetical protein